MVVTMPFFETYLVCVLGIIVSIILPILRKSLSQISNVGEKGGAEIFLSRVWRVARPYVVIGCFSLVAGLLIVAFAGDFLKDWKTALLAGYAWDSTLQKVTRG